MALQIRRGSDVDRQGITPKAGEPIFTTDTKKLYIGDGATVGGIIVDTTAGLTNIVEDTTPQLGGNLDLNNNTINGSGNISITGQISATSIDLKGSIFADDSTLLVDGISGRIVGPVHANVTGDVTGNVTGNLTGDVTGDVTGTITGDISGSVFADDSTVLVDAISGTITAPVDTTGNVETTAAVTAGTIRLNPPGLDHTIAVHDTSATQMTLTTFNTSGEVVSARPFRIGGTSGSISEGTLKVFNANGNVALVDLFDYANDATAGLVMHSKSRGTKASPTTVQDSDALGSFLANGYNGANYRLAGGVSVQVDGTPAANYIPAKVVLLTSNSAGSSTVQFSVDKDGIAEFNGPAQLKSYDASGRDGVSAVNGMMIYNSDTNKVQAYAGGSWVDLH